MFKEIVIPSSENQFYKFPVETYGKKVEISIEDTNSKQSGLPSIKDLLKPFIFDSGGFKFNRKEANNYE